MPEINIPGTEIEKALAGQVTRAGQLFWDTIGSYVRRWTVRGNMKAEAEGEDLAADIKQAGDLRRYTVAAAHRRDELLVEAEWQATAARALGRFQSELLKEQENVEAIAHQGFVLVNSDPDSDNNRKLEDDWLLRFFQYAAKVDDAQLQAVMARALADAAVADRPLTSHRAVDTIRFFERESYAAFTFVARELARFGSVPRGYFSLKHETMPTGFDLAPLMEIGLVKAERQKSTDLRLGPISFLLTFAPRETFAFELVSLTQIGREIAALITPGVRKRFGMGTARPTAEELWDIQKALGLNGANVRAAAVATVQEASDGWALAIEAYQRQKDGTTVTLFGGSRDAIEQPFGIPSLSPVAPWLDTELQSLIKIVVGEFQHFDEHQLPNLVSEPFVSEAPQRTAD